MRPERSTRAWVGLALAVLLIGLAFALPSLLDWEVHSRASRSASTRGVPPLHGLWEPKLWGPGTLPAVLLAALAVRYGVDLSERLRWRALLPASYAVGLAWLLALALVDGTAGLSRALGNPYEYLGTAREAGDLGVLLSTWVDRIPIGSPEAFVTHVAGHPPGMLLVFVALVHLGLGGDLAAGVVVTVLAATTPPAVLTALRALDAERVARRAAPFLTLGPAAVFTAVSADGLLTALAAWGLAALALAATRPTRGAATAWAVVAGLLLGYLVMSSYGLVLVGLIALAVLAVARSWGTLPVAAIAALAVVLVFAAGGFAWWEAYPVLHDRYWDGIAEKRPASYWMWANLALLALSAGPLLGAGLAHVLVRPRVWLATERTTLLLVSAASACVLVADLSRMSKAEVERIWLPFMPWLLLSCALLPERWRRRGLALQVATALVVQQLFYTSW